jgi:hypothetical protein
MILTKKFNDSSNLSDDPVVIGEEMITRF